ncbi:MAG: hypothetical protein ACI8RZ_005514 [Myxococcota bacterium]|jgi:hypothetical protein
MTACSPEILAARSVVLWESGSRDAACSAALQAAEQAGDRIDLFGRAGSFCLQQGHLSAAEHAFETITRLDSGWPVGHHLLGTCRMRQGRPVAAIAPLRQAASLEPNTPSIHTALAEALLSAGQLEAGWKQWTWRFGGRIVPPHPEHPAPVWDGTALNGRVLMLWLEQGLGDQLQFVRFVRRIQGRVWLQAPRRLHSLFESLPVERLIDAGESVSGFDVQLPLLSLPMVLGVGLTNLDSAAYLQAPDQALPMLEPADGTFRVGLVWGSKPTHPSAPLRDCPLPLLATLSTVPGVSLYGLQFGDAARALQDHPDITDLSSILGDFGQTAAIVERMDLIITVDTAMAHLAGSLGVPVWTLLGRDPDWRWMCDRADSPWYRSMRLFRNTEGWPALVEAVQVALRERLQ